MSMMQIPYSCGIPCKHVCIHFNALCRRCAGANGISLLAVVRLNVISLCAVALQNDTVTLHRRYAQSHKMKLAISYALAQVCTMPYHTIHMLVASKLLLLCSICCSVLTRKLWCSTYQQLMAALSLRCTHHARTSCMRTRVLVRVCIQYAQADCVLCVRAAAVCMLL